MQEPIDVVYAGVLPEMKKNNIEDTTENRLAFLQGLLDAWEEDPERSVEKSIFMLAVQSEIQLLKLEVRGFNVR